MCPKLPLAYGYTNGLDTMRAVHIYNQGALTNALFLTFVFETARFQGVKTKRSKRLSICLVTHTTHPQGNGGMSNDAKLQFNSELNNHRLYENDDEDENFKISDL